MLFENSYDIIDDWLQTELLTPKFRNFVANKIYRRKPII